MNNLNDDVMENYLSTKNPLNTILSLLVVGLDVILVLIALGFVVGLVQLIS
jgi:uncharacterized membrane protein SpoIIM required for sporulation